MLEFLNSVSGATGVFISLGILCVLNFLYSMQLRLRFKKMEELRSQDKKHLLEIADDVKALYSSGTTLGKKIKSLDYETKIQREELDKLSLKDPNQQMYKNAVQLINSGESINKISESSGLAHGEVELLKLFQRIEKDLKKDSATE